MGKSRPRNRVKNRDNPAAKPPPSDPELAAIREKRILPVIQDLQCAQVEKRSAAAKAIANIIQDTKCRKLLLREQIVRILFEQTLTDSSLESRTAGWGILRNLALEEEADFCIHLYRQDVLTAIEGVARNILETIQSEDAPFSKLPRAQQDLVWNITSSVTNLIASLSEAQEEIVEAISKLSSIVRFLFGVVTCRTTPSEVQNEALSCLTTLTEDNRSLDEEIVANAEWFESLFAIKDGQDFNAITTCGVLHNIFTSLKWFDHNTQKEGASDATLIPILVESMEMAQVQSNGSNGQTKNANPDQILQLALEITASIATSLQEALEHASRHEKVFEGFDDSDNVNDDEDKMDTDDEDAPQEEGEDAEDDAEMNEEEIDADMDLVLGDGSDEDDGPIEEVSLDRLVRLAAPTILRLAQSSGGEGHASMPHPIPNIALSSLNNIAWTISSIDFSTGHLNSLMKFWSSLVQQIWDQVISPVLASNTADIELASSITSLAWALCRSVQGKVTIKPDEPKKFMALYHASKSLPASQSNRNKKPQEDTDAFQSLGVKSIGVLGRLALDPAPLDLNKEIGAFLIRIVMAIPDTPAADAVEALNQIFDIYGDQSLKCDQYVYWNFGFQMQLEKILPEVKRLAKTIDKRHFTELRARTDEAVLNLDRFLKYKKKEKRDTV